MSQVEHFDVLVLGSGQGGQLIAGYLAKAGRHTAVVERRWIAGSCPTIACMPSKTEIWSARIAHFAQHGSQFGVVTDSVTICMPTVLRRKRDMVSREVDLHLQKNFNATGTELIVGDGRFTAPKTLEVRLNDGGTRLLAADQVFSTLARTRQCPPFPASRPPGR
jgi:pyruvate/2-oxoglutarate dehydrogenase complex dihydrolipoamide dehydrogenase (E3) component